MIHTIMTVIFMVSTQLSHTRDQLNLPRTLALTMAPSAPMAEASVGVAAPLNIAPKIAAMMSNGNNNAMNFVATCRKGSLSSGGSAGPKLGLMRVAMMI